MQSKSWNIAVPFKEQRFYHTPSESIANNYTPSASHLKIRRLPKRAATQAYPGDGYYRGGIETTFIFYFVFFLSPKQTTSL